ncbi:N-acetylmuramoyl-L-alanine amidase-like domain-containing protein [Algoriphagus namhaensis]|uniref:N-acetylmuramoyl-L-alanine amidase-like domain-containing protein n=1 Tax=Algoriphagus namhaensis TaxID=915353 RepID=A0ABV8ALR2_9BACT
MRYFTLLFLLIPNLITAQAVCTPESRELLEEKLERLESLDVSGLSSGELAAEIGQWFLGTEYVAKTLELPGEEKLVINLQGVDCTTYLESVIALTRLAQKQEYTFEAFEGELELIRYRNGENTGYPSRLHYFSDWMYANGEKGLFQNITQEIGGVPYPNQPSFMSENPQFYPQLADPKNVEAIKATEAEIGKRSYFYIPKEKVAEVEDQIQSGNLIAITTTINNLDMVHVGFAIEHQGRIHLLHASSASMQVEISDLPLSDYLARNKTQSGIMVSKILSP